MDDRTLAFPRFDAACRIAVLIPARDEAALIGDTLASLALQTDNAGAPMGPGLVQVCVLANGCTDDTASIASNYARAFGGALDVFERPFEAPATIGAIRKLMFDAAAASAFDAGRPGMLLASIDADTIVSPTWIATLLRESIGVDAVAGYVTVGDPEETLPASLAEIYRTFLAYGDRLAELESICDPRREDPYPRHGSFVGASFAVTADSYRRAGGIPAVDRIEDRLFADALVRIDARIRHSLALTSRTSARRQSRLIGGFGTLLGHLETCGSEGLPFLVTDPHESLSRFAMRGAIARIRSERSQPDDVAMIAERIGAGRADVERRIARATTLGRACETILESLPASRCLVPLDEAFEMLDAMCRTSSR